MTLSESLRQVSLELSSVRGDRSIVEAVERDLQRDPGCIQFDARGFATLSAAGRRWDAGRFETPTLATLRQRAAARQKVPGAHVTFSVLSGESALSDIGTLQGFADEGSLFQVASQFNGLEARDPYIAPITEYLTDPTQGPRASISAFPGTFVRHSAAPRADGTRGVQTEQSQLNFLEHFCRPGVARVNCGYLQTENITDRATFARLLEEEFDQLRVGVHEGVEVVFGSNWDGPVRVPAPRIAQVFTSTWAGGGYSEGTLGAEHERVLRQLQRGAYLGTFLAAAALGQRRVVTTLIGGGVFDNPQGLIWDAILWGLDQLEAVVATPMEVVVNARPGIDGASRSAVLARVAASGGELMGCDGGVVRVTRPAAPALVHGA